MIIPSERRDEEQQILDHLCRGEHIDHFETVRITKTGGRVSVSLAISPVRNSTGEIIGASKVARDITERKKAQEAIQESELSARLSNFRMKNEDKRANCMME